MGLPLQQEFWNYLFDINMDWGLTVYEQDWLSTVEDEVQLLSSSTSFGRQWLHGMATAADAHNINIQYCMSYPRHLLSSVELSAVTQIRASHDYHPGNDQWQIGISSIFASSLDIMPSKDSYWSQNDAQSGHYAVGTNESHNRLQSAVLSLSNGPVTFSDRIGYSNASLIMKCCMASGLLLRPDVSATMIDKYFLYKSGLNTSNAMGVDGRIWSTYSVIGDNEFYKYLYVFAVNFDREYQLTENGNGHWLAYETNTTSKFYKFDEKTPLKIKKGNEYDFQLYTLIPIQNSNDDMWYLQGEVDKWITVSNQRFQEITRNDDGTIKVAINGQVGEEVRIAFVNANSFKQHNVTCIFDETEQMI